MNIAKQARKYFLKTNNKTNKHTFLLPFRKAWFFIGLAFFLTLSIAEAQSWTWQNPQPQGNTLTSVCFPDTNIGYSVGLDGTILKTINGGNDWIVQNNGLTISLSSVFFTDTLTAYAIGASSTILKTIDGGLNWIPQTIGVPYLTSVFFTNSDTGYVVELNPAKRDSSQQNRNFIKCFVKKVLLTYAQ